MAGMEAGVVTADPRPQRSASAAEAVAPEGPAERVRPDLSPTAEDLARSRAVRVANLAACLEAARRERGIRSWSDLFSRQRQGAA